MRSAWRWSGKRSDEDIHRSKNVFLIRPKYVVARMRDANYLRSRNLCLEGFRLVLGYAEIACLERSTRCRVILQRTKIVRHGKDDESRSMNGRETLLAR